MKVPEFTAESSLGKATQSYRVQRPFESLSAGRSAAPVLPSQYGGVEEGLDLGDESVLTDDALGAEDVGGEEALLGEGGEEDDVEVSLDGDEDLLSDEGGEEEESNSGEEV